MCAQACRGWWEVPRVFLNPSIFYFLRQSLPLTLELTDSSRLVDHQTPGICLPLLPAPHPIPVNMSRLAWILCGFQRSKISFFVLMQQSTLSQALLIVPPPHPPGDQVHALGLFPNSVNKVGSHLTHKCILTEWPLQALCSVLRDPERKVKDIVPSNLAIFEKKNETHTFVKSNELWSKTLVVYWMA